MTQWLSSTDPMAMLNWLNEVTGFVYGYPAERARKPSDRKLRLFAAACYRDVAEAARPFADAYRAADEAEFWAEQGHAAPGVRESSIPVDTHDRAIDHATGAATWAHYHRGSRTPEQLATTQAALLRDIVGNPFRPAALCGNRDHGSVGVRPYCPACRRILNHADSLVPKLAQVIYDERRWELMPMLADALEEAGCREEVILRWCRGQERCPCPMGRVLNAPAHGNEEMCGGRGWIPRRGPSVRGDWVIDLLIGKE